MQDYDRRLAALRAILTEKEKLPTDLLRAAGMTEPGKYAWGLRVLRGGQKGEPTLAKLEKAAAYL